MLYTFSQLKRISNSYDFASKAQAIEIANDKNADKVIDDLYDRVESNQGTPDIGVIHEPNKSGENFIKSVRSATKKGDKYKNTYIARKYGKVVKGSDIEKGRNERKTISRLVQGIKKDN